MSGDIMIVGEENIERARQLALRSAISLWLRTGMIPNRNLTVSRLRHLAAQVTGKATYVRGRKGMQQAFDDLTAHLGLGAPLRFDTEAEAQDYLREHGISHGISHGTLIRFDHINHAWQINVRNGPGEPWRNLTAGD